jgi:hypothetical protein
VSEVDYLKSLFREIQYQQKKNQDLVLRKENPISISLTEILEKPK